MKKTTIIILTAAAALFAASCSVDEKVNTDNQQKIGFDFKVCSETEISGVQTKSASQVYELQGGNLDSKLLMYSSVSDFSDGIITRGTPINDMSQFYDSFGVMAYKYQGGWEETSCIPNYMHDIEVTKASGWKTDFHWPGKGCNMRFFAYAPYQCAGLTLSSAIDPGMPKITYAVPAEAEAEDQPDLLYAVGNEVTGDNYQPVSLTFKHALTGVRFVMGDIEGGKITKVTLRNVFGSGTYTMDADTWGDWDDAESEFTQSLDVEIGDTPGAITPEYATFMMIPQTLTEDAAIEIEYVDDNGNSQTLTADIGGSEWPMGKIVTYKISISHNLSFTVSDGEDEVTFEMVPVTGGTFWMGAQCDDHDLPNYDEDAQDNEKPVHPVTLSDYWIGKFEVTQGLWMAVMSKDNPSYENPSYFTGYTEDLQRPVERVSWNDICGEEDGFLAKLNAALSSKLDEMGMEFVLPTEAQWEFAASGGIAGYEAENGRRKHIYSGSNIIDDVAWWGYLSDPQGTATEESTYPVGQKQANELGIYDMSGNVWEWCLDWHTRTYYQECLDQGTVENPKGPDSGSYRVLRGSSLAYDAAYCRVSYRNTKEPGIRYGDLGLRLALVPR